MQREFPVFRHAFCFAFIRSKVLSKLRNFSLRNFIDQGPVVRRLNSAIRQLAIFSTVIKMLETASIIDSGNRYFKITKV